MAQLDALLGNANFDETEGTTAYEPLPAGDYVAQIVYSETKETSKGGTMLVLQYEIIDGPHSGRKVYDNLNIINASKKAEAIAHGMLKNVCLACGLNTGWPEDSLLLHEKPLAITLGVKNDPNYGPKNNVKKVEPVGGNSSQAPSTPTGGGNPGTARKPAWKK